MDFLSEKLNSYSASALSGVNEFKRKRKQKQTEQELQQQTNTTTTTTTNSPPQTTQVKSSANTSSSVLLLKPNTRTASHHHQLNIDQQRSPFSASIPFGADSFAPFRQTPQAPAPIGFRLDLVVANNEESNTSKSNAQQHQQPDLPKYNQQLVSSKRHNVSESSLYEGDAWTRLWFQRVMILTLIRLFLFISKIYEDFQATKLYRSTGSVSHYAMALATLFMPTLVFTIYRVARYLQIALPGTRYKSTPEAAPTQPSVLATTSPAQAQTVAEPARALNLPVQESSRNKLSSSSSRHEQSLSQLQQEEEGLVTARQTPTVLDEYHDSKSQQDQQLTAAVTPTLSAVPPTGSARVVDNDDFRERVDMSKLGDLPDRETVRVSIGASEQLLHGILFVFWQLKRQVDVVGYLVERSCLWRKPKQQEKEELERMRTGSDGLEWFQDFYAAFLAILAQVYTLALNWSVNTKTNVMTPIGLLASAPSPAGELSVSNAAKALANTLQQQQQQQLLTQNSLSSKDLLIMSQLLVSSAVVFSLLIAVRRRDDGPLTLGLSMLGWGSVFASRIIIIAMAFVHLGANILVPLIAIHILAITVWVYKIAIDSHNGKKGESDEAKWDSAPQSEPLNAIELESGNAQSSAAVELKATDQWSFMEHVVLVLQVLTLFAIPSLFYWPIMFNLKLHCRPFKYLVLILSENFLLVVAILYSIAHTATSGQWYLLGAASAFSITGFIFVSLYVSCKPSLTEYFARADELFNEAEKSGIYFEFCSRVFKMPDLSKHAFQRLMNQSGPVEEIELVEDDVIDV